ncbi:MAG: TonB-dependent receptor [Candidatus Omnitrophica bacterium]|jgi:iron complex outermembrane receptor protein|nr:TonB-dependent receptor [Candidatus Omnitrophota bacterium]MDD5725020.1 TonB-dependent receptor [Candidatus Omnitrophota bacterium]
MSGLRICGLIFVLLFFNPGNPCAFGGIDHELEPLVILKQKQLLLNEYTTESGENEDFDYQSGVENLVNLPVDVQSRSLRSGIEAGFSLRGSTSQQVLVLLNGQRINEPQTSYYNSDIPFTKEDIEKIDVMPGAGSGLFGPDAVGGAINFSLSPPKEKKIIWESGIGSNRNGYSLFSFSDKRDNLGVRFSVEDAQSRGYRYDTDYKKFTSSLSASYGFARGSWDNNFGYQEKDFGAYDFYTPGMGYPSREATKVYLLSSGLNLDYDGLLVKPAFLWRRHYDTFILDETGLRSTQVNHHHTDIITPSFYLQKDMGVFGKTGFGSEWSEERIVSTNLGNHTRDRQSLFLDNRIAIGERWEIGSCIRGENFSGFGMTYSGSLNARFTLVPDLSWSFGVSRNIRLPSFTELYYSDPTTIGNDALEAEKVWNYETGLEYKKGGFLSRVSLFMRREREMIDWVRKDPGEKWQARNFTRDEVFGAEYALHQDFSRFLALDANYSYADKQIDSQGYLYKYGPNYASHLANAVFTITLPFGRQEIGFNYKKRPGRNGWLLMSAGLNYNLSGDMKIFLRAENIFNTEYQDIEGIPQPGRYLEAGLRCQW